MRLLNLTRGYTAIVDDADYERVAAFKWFAHVVRYPDGRIKRVAAARQERPISGGPQRTIYLHRWLLGVVNPLIQVDHESTNALDDRRDNLRICTNSQNSRNRNRHHDNKSGYKGVCWKPREKKWVAQITVDGQSCGHRVIRSIRQTQRKPSSRLNDLRFLQI